MSSSYNFTQAYQQLNPAQKQAVDSIDDTVMVMAGPGTGKTQVLATRIANILDKQDVEPSNILALTFTDAGVFSMRKRLVELIGTAGYFVSIMTFHSFASEVITSYPEKFPIQKNSEPLSDFEKFEIFEELLTTTKLKELKPLNAPLYYIDAVISQISQLKREYVSPDKLERLIKDDQLILAEDIQEYWHKQEDKKRRGKKSKDKLSVKLFRRQRVIKRQQELLLIYTKYLAQLKVKKRYDFDDMISFVVQAFEHDEELLLDYQERYQYILVDEYQDTNASQNRIVELLASFWEENPHLFVVGDPHQSIFRFQGASAENMLEFIKKYPSAKVITLTIGYRCNQDVYDTAYHLVQDSSLSKMELPKIMQKALFTKLIAVNQQNLAVTVYEAENKTVELLFLVEEIKKLEKQGVSLDEVAVLYKNNSEVVAIQEMLEKWDIKYELAVGGNALDDLLVQQLLTFFQVMRDTAHGESNPHLFTIMQYQWLSLDRLTVYKLVRIANKLRLSILDILDKEYSDLTKLVNDKELHPTKVEFNSLVSFKDKLLRWYHKSHDLMFHEWFSLVVNHKKDNDGFAFIPYLISRPIKTDHLYVINSLYTEVKRMVSNNHSFSLDDFLYRIQVMQEHRVKIKVDDLNITKNRVALSTAHSSKGKQWQYVFILSCNDKKWGNQVHRELIPLPDGILTNTDISKREKNDDDLRLFYVALTRSSKKSYLSWSKTKENGKEINASMFITQIKDFTKPLAIKQQQYLSSSALELLEKKLTTTKDYQLELTAKEKAFFEKLVDEFKLSVTSLNAYLRDPQDFLINSLLRAPKAKQPFMSFGTAIHRSLEDFYLNYQQLNKIMTVDELINSFVTALTKERLSDDEFIRRKEYGAEVLTKYYNKYLKTPVTPLMMEKSFNGIILLDGANEIKLSGRIDRVDLIDKTKRTIRVVDYKTGKFKSDKVVNGVSGTDDFSKRERELPEIIRGPMKRQLIFYKLLAQLDKTFPYTVTKAEFDYIEPTGTYKDQHKKLEYLVTDQEVEALKELIITVSREIRELKFV